MLRNRTSDLILDTAPLGTNIAGATTVGKQLVIAPDCDDLHLVFRLEVAAATLVGDLIFKLGNQFVDDLLVSAGALAAGVNALPPILLTAPVTQYTAVPTGITVDATKLQYTFATAAIGVHTWAVKLMHPPNSIWPYFAFTSGGGNMRLRVKAVY